MNAAEQRGGGQQLHERALRIDLEISVEGIACFDGFQFDNLCLECRLAARDCSHPRQFAHVEDGDAAIRQ